MESSEDESHPYLKIVSGPLSGQTRDLEPYRLVRIGRGEETGPEAPDVLRLVLDDKRLSRNHAQLERTDTGWHARDLGSSNGTFVDGERVSHVALRAGQLIQVGTTVFELASSLSEVSSTNACEAEEMSPESTQERARKLPIVVLGAMILLAGAIGGFVLLRDRGGPAEGPAPSSGSAEKASASRGPTPRPRVDPEPVLPTPSDDDEVTALVHASLAAGDYRRAMSQLEGAARGCKPETIAALRSKTLKAAEAELEEESRTARRLAGANEFDSARATLEDALLRVPEELAQKALETLEELRTLELARKAAEPELPKRIAASEAEEASLELRLTASAASFQALKERQDVAPGDWTVFVTDLKRLVSDWRLLSSYVSHRQQIREMHGLAFARSQPADAIRALFAARTVEWKGGRLRLLYDFTSDDQLRDFTSVSRAPGVLERKKGGLALRGECRLLHGNPFTRGLAVRATIPEGGWTAEAPNVNVALFTSSTSRLTDDARAAPSLFNSFQLTTGSEPNDFAAFLWGYRAVVADYGGRKIEELTPTGSDAAVGMPLQALLFGRSGQMLHQDRRECVSAIPAHPTPGPLTLEIVLKPEVVSWSVNGKPVAPLKTEWVARLKAIAAGTGSVTLFTRGSQVLFSSIEVEGQLDPAWIEGRLVKAAVRELDRVERG